MPQSRRKIPMTGSLLVLARAPLHMSPSRIRRNASIRQPYCSDNGLAMIDRSD